MGTERFGQDNIVKGSPIPDTATRTVLGQSGLECRAKLTVMLHYWERCVWMAEIIENSIENSAKLPKLEV